MTKQYVEIYYPGSFFNETTIQEVESRDPIELPKGAFAFRFFEKTEVETVDGEILMGKPKNYSGIHYKGVVYTLEEVKEQFPDSRTLISNMESNDWSRVIKTVRGNFQPFEDNDVLL